MKTRSLYEGMKKFLIDCVEYVERKVKRKVKNRKEDLGEKRTGRKEKQIGEKFHGLCVPSQVHTRIIAATAISNMEGGCWKL